MHVDAGEALTFATIKPSIFGNGTHLVAAARIHTHKSFWLSNCVVQRDALLGDDLVAGLTLALGFGSSRDKRLAAAMPNRLLEA